MVLESDFQADKNANVIECPRKRLLSPYLYEI